MLASKGCPVGMSSCTSVELVENHWQIEPRMSRSSCLPNSRIITKSPLRH
jgi:hypothetical protein